MRDATTLADARPGMRVRVAGVGGEAPLARRLLEMGLLPGTEVEVARAAPLGDPMVLKLRGYTLSVRRAEAAAVRTGGGAAPVFEDAPNRAEVAPIPASRTLTARPRIVLAGNPNAGKTTLFNALTGSSARVGNYPGITVEKLTGTTELERGRTADVLDVPGTYSLTARSSEEQVAIDVLLPDRGPHPDAVIVVVDATSLSRGLYLAVQILEAGMPTVIALNMMDEARAQGLHIDAAQLGASLGAEVVPVVAARREGLDALRAAVVRAMQTPRVAVPLALSEPLDRGVRELESELAMTEASARRARALWALQSADATEVTMPPALRAVALRVRAEALADGRDVDLELIARRYAHVDRAVLDTLRRDPARRPVSERIDAVLTHPVLGLGVFAVTMLVLFESLFAWSEPAMALIEAGVSVVRTAAAASLPEGALRDLFVDGVLAGVGNVVVFVPQIAVLFLFIAFLEDSGYLARVALMVDRVMARVGLHGRAFVPLLSGFSCAIPAVMATRTIESRRDRLVTMLALPLMSCSARLPIYTLVIATVFHGNTPVLGFLSVGGLVLFAMYAFSVVATLLAASVLGRTVLKGERPPLVLELPPYRWPSARSLARAVWTRVRSFLVDAGTMILAFTIVLWALLTYPKDAALEARFAARATEITASTAGEEREAALEQLSHERGEAALAASFAGQLGHFIEPAIRPLGFDWKLGVGLIGSFAAREVLISTLGVVYGLGETDVDDPAPLRKALQDARNPDGTKVFTPLTGVSLMVFFVLACQCMSTIAVVRRESGSWKWAALMFTYMTALAYVASLAVYQTGSALGWGTS